MEYTVDRVLDFISNTQVSTVHLVDVENLAGAGKLSRHEVALARSRYFKAVHPGRNDLFVVAAGPGNKTEVFEGWPQATYRFKKGTSGADLALVEFYQSLANPERFQHVYIATGDAELLPVADQATLSGAEVIIVSAMRRCSRKFNGFAMVPLEMGDAA